MHDNSNQQGSFLINSEQALILKSGQDTLDCTFPQIMGILNLTPDSFHDGGHWIDSKTAYERAEKMVLEGATIIDVGAESTRPGAIPVSEQEELDRLLPVLEKICKLPVWISIDTYKLAIMKYAYSKGVKLFNNVEGFRSSQALEWAVKKQVAICIMHMHGNPQTMAKNIFSPKEGIFQSLNKFFEGIVLQAKALGMSSNQIILDPGFGFGKSLDDNFRLLAKLSNFSLFPSHLFLAGTSNKRMLRALTLPERQDILMIGANANSALYAALQGYKILRVHDVTLAKNAINFYKKIKESS